MERPVLYQSKSHWISHVFPVLCIIIGLVGIPGFFILYGLLKLFSLLLIILFYKGVSALLRKRSVKLHVTEGTLSISSGVFYKIEHDIPIHKIKGVAVCQSVIGRILNYGVIGISTGDNVLSYSISNPDALKNELMNQMQNKL